eukprot:348184_1
MDTPQLVPFLRRVLSSVTTTTVDEHDTEHESDHAFEAILLLLPFSLLLGNITRHICIEFHIPLPYTVILLGIGFALGIAEYYRYDRMGILGDAILSVKTLQPHLLLGVFIPPLIFESAFGTDFHVIRRSFWQAVLLAGPGVIINVILISVFCVYAFPYQWNWAEAITFSSIVSATDPVAVVSLLRDLGASKRLATLIEGESLLNDGSAFVLFAIAIEFVLDPSNPPGAGEIIKELCVLTFGGIAVGLAFGMGVVLWLRTVFNDERVEIVITLLACYLCFWVCENGFTGNEMSGVLGTVFLGLFLSKYKSAISPSIEQSLHHFWVVASYIANTLIFVFGGIIVVLGIIEDDRLAVSGADTDVITTKDIGWLVLLYIAVHAARFVTIMILWRPLKKMGYNVTFQECIVLTFAGLRGVIALSLALMVKLTVSDETLHLIKYQDQTMFHVAGIVALTLLINGTFMQVIVKGLGLLKMSHETEVILKDAMHHLQHENRKTISTLKGDGNYFGANWEEVTKVLPSYAHMVGEKDAKAEKTMCYYWCCECSPCCLKKQNKARSISISDANILSGEGGITLRTALKGRHNESKYMSRRFGDYPIPLDGALQASTEMVKKGFEFEPIQEDDEDECHDVDPMTLPPDGQEENKIDTEDMGNEQTPELDTFTRAFSINLTPLELNESDGALYGDIRPMMSPICSAPCNIQKKLTKKEIEHRILQVLQRSYDTEYDEGNITDYAFMTLEHAIDCALDNDSPDESSLNILKQHVVKGLKINPIIKWMYKQCQNGLTQFFLLQQLSEAIEVGLVFSSAFQALPKQIECVSVVRNNAFTGDVLTDLHRIAEDIHQEWTQIHEEYPEVYTAIQTKHAVQTILHHETADVRTLYNRGVLDEAEKARMIKLLSQTQHNIYFSSFYYVTSIYGTSLSHKQTLLSVLFMTKLNRDTYEGVVNELFTKIELKEYEQGQHVISTARDQRAANGIYVIVSGRCALLECGHFSVRTGYEEDLSGDSHPSPDTKLKQPFLADEKTESCEMSLCRGCIIGGYEYLAKMEYLNPCVAKTKVMAYFIDNETLTALLDEEKEAYETLWKQCATNLILAMYPKNDRSFFNQYSTAEINTMCQKSEFKSFDEEDVNQRKLLLNDFEKMALILYGKCYYDIDGDEVAIGSKSQKYNETELLWTHPRPYVFEEHSKILILAIPKHNTRKGINKRIIV